MTEQNIQSKLILYIRNEEILPFIKATEFIRHRKDIKIKSTAEDEEGVKYEIYCSLFIAFRLGRKFENFLTEHKAKNK